MPAKVNILSKEHKYILSGIIFFMFIIFSCNTLNHKEIFPLKRGNFWIIKTTRYHDNGEFSYFKIDTTNIIKDTIINNNKYYLLADNYNKTNIRYFINTENGLYIYSNKYLPTDLIFKYPGKVGDKFKNVGIDTIRIDSINTEFKIGMRNISCYKYTITKKGISNPWNGNEILLKENIYMSPGIGWIYYCSLKIFDDKIIKVEERELIDFLVK